MVFDWSGLTLFLYIMARMTGFVLFNPLLAQNGVPGIFHAGFILMLSVAVNGIYEGTVEVPATVLELGLRMGLELCVGLMIGMLMRFFLFIPEQAGEVMDTQMGLSMAKTYDPTAHSSLTTNATLLRILMILLFFAENGHLTLLRLMMCSGEVVPFGSASFGRLAANYGVEVFVDCVLLSVKLSLPILAAELMGQVGMGVLMKAIPQINVFVINIDLKVIIGLFMLLMLLDPISQLLLEIESTMLSTLQQSLNVMLGT